MLRILITKELMHNLLSFRFVAGLLFVVIVYAGNSVIFCKKFQNELEEYRRAQDLYETSLKSGEKGLDQLFEEEFALTKEPRLSSFLVSGNESRFPNSFRISPVAAQRGRLFAGMNPNIQRGNYKLEEYTDFDLLFIIGVLLSFLAIVLSFDAISRDREEGTLKLQLSMPVPRARVLTAKYIAILILLLIAILLSSILSIIVSHVFLGRSVVASTPVEAFLTGIFGILYLSLFVWLGLWMSSLVSKPATSLALLLLVWTFFVVLGPYLGGMISQRYHRVASAEEFDKQFKAVVDGIFRNAPREYLDFYAGKESEEGWKAIERHFERSDNTMEQFVSHRFTELYNQATTAESFNSISPYSALRQSVEQITNAGLSYHKKFFDAARRYRYTLVSFIRQQDLLDPQSKHHVVPIPRMKAMSTKPVDPQTIPRFVSSGRGVSAADVQQALPLGAYLLLLNLVFFLLAQFTLARSDVR
jgi:ABC-type transport system involved in multi-copper enzyme maturation permease subunit